MTDEQIKLDAGMMSQAELARLRVERVRLAFLTRDMEGLDELIKKEIERHDQLYEEWLKSERTTTKDFLGRLAGGDGQESGVDTKKMDRPAAGPEGRVTG